MAETKKIRVRPEVTVTVKRTVKRIDELLDPDYFGKFTIGDLVWLAENDKSTFRKGLDTPVRLADVEGNLGTISDLCINANGSIGFDEHGGVMS